MEQGRLAPWYAIHSVSGAHPEQVSQSNNTLRQVIPGGYLAIVGATRPPVSPRGQSAWWSPTIDRWPVTPTEGDPLSLAAKRQTTFWNRKPCSADARTEGDIGGLARMAQKDQRRFTCRPQCEHKRAALGKRTVGTRALRRAHALDALHGHKPQTALTFAELRCGGTMSRWEAVTLAWRATVPFNGVAGFIPGFLSPWLTLTEIVFEFLEARKIPGFFRCGSTPCSAAVGGSGRNGRRVGAAQTR